MKMIAAIIGMGIGQKHLDAIENYKKSFVKIICEKNEKKIKFLNVRFFKLLKQKYIAIVVNDKNIKSLLL